MKVEHFVHVSEQYSILRTYHFANRPEAWREDREGSLVISTLHVDIEDDDSYCIGGYDVEGSAIGIFVNIPSEEIANTVLQYILNTEILFI